MCHWRQSLLNQSTAVLLGYWYGIVKDGSDFFGIEALDISKQSDSTYALIRYGKGIKDDFILPDTSYFSGYTLLTLGSSDI
jgi:hypothetical protein